VIHIEPAAGTYEEKSFDFVVPGLGGRIGAKFNVTPSFTLQGTVDAIGLSARPQGGDGAAHPRVIVDNRHACFHIPCPGGRGFCGMSRSGKTAILQMR
jgi:hypothetical protein